MDPFPFPDLPTDIATRVVSELGSDSFRNLGSLIRSGKAGGKIALSTQVLKELPLNEFFLQPSLSYPNSNARDFFLGCVLSNNPTACYLEGIRLICQEGSVEQGLMKLSWADPSSPHIKFAAAIFLICGGHYRRGRRIVNRLEQEINSFDTLNGFGTHLIEFILEMRVQDNIVEHWGWWWEHDDYPMCAQAGCSYHARCPNCYIYWITTQVVTIC